VTPISEPLWRELRAAPAPRRLGELAAAIGATPRCLLAPLAGWARAGLVTVQPGSPRHYVMADDNPTPPKIAGGTAQPRQPSQRQRLWTAVRVLKRFDVPTVMMTAEAPKGATQSFVNQLLRAGYARKVSAGNGYRGVAATYVLTRKVGRLAPSVTHRYVDDRLQVTFIDRNTGDRRDISPSVVSLRPFAARDGGGVG
jgi:hypothetical protein